MIIFSKCSVLFKKTYCKASNAAIIVRLFKLAAQLQLSGYNNINVSTFKISKSIVGPIKRFVLDRKVTLQTLTNSTYEQQLWNGVLVLPDSNVTLFE